MTIHNEVLLDQEAIALANCYHLLLQKAEERRKRLKETAVALNQLQDKKLITARHQELLEAS